MLQNTIATMYSHSEKGNIPSYQFNQYYIIYLTFTVRELDKVIDRT